MGRRPSRSMVPEDDPQWVRFWTAYPWRSAKLDARHAWMQVGVTSACLDRILVALSWQVPMWQAQGYGMPLPASYLRGARWEDEPLPVGTHERAVTIGARMPHWAAKAKGLIP